MSRLVIVTIFLAAFCLTAPAVTQGGAQQKRIQYGPVVRAYLTGLTEELNELEYQLRNHEIDQADYDRSKQRLAIMRFYVEHFAAQSGEDSVPELQVLADHELSALGLDVKPNPDQLRVGDLPGGGWKLINIERGEPARQRYFVFNRLPFSEKTPLEKIKPIGKSTTGPQKKYDPLAVIETIIVRDRQIPSPASVPKTQPDSTSNRDAQITAETADASTSPSSLSGNAAQPEPQFQPPQILFIQLPQYTEKARNRGVWGELIVRGIFKVDGKIKDVKVVKSLGDGLDKQAVESVRRTKFQPAQIDGRVVDASMQIVFNFKFGRVAFYTVMAEPQASAK